MIKPHIVAVTEVKPKNFKERLAQNFSIDGYTSHLCNLQPGSDLGTIIYTRQSNDRSISEIDPITAFSELTLLEIKLSCGDKLLFGCLYRSPASSDLNNKLLSDLIRLVSNGSHSHVCLVGDFNLCGINNCCFSQLCSLTKV